MPSLAALAYRVARMSGATALARRLRPGAVVLCYHNVVDARADVPDPALHIQRDRFDRQVGWVADRFTLVPLDELLRRRASGRSLRGLAAITFDDAYLGTIRHGLAILAQRALPATVFVPTAFPSTGEAFWWDEAEARAAAQSPVLRDRWLESLAGDADAIRQSGGGGAPPPPDCRVASWEQLRAAASPIVAFEAHSVTHRTLPRLDDTALAGELTQARDALERELGARPTSVAYPYGRWDVRVAAAARAAGYAAGWTLAAADVTATGDAHALPRVNVPAGIADDTFEAWMSGLAGLRRG